MKVVIVDETRTVEIHVPGKYNPDILEDMTNRASRLYYGAVEQEVESYGREQETETAEAVE